jgi:hypothetical protein
MPSVCLVKRVGEPITHMPSSSHCSLLHEMAVTVVLLMVWLVARWTRVSSETPVACAVLWTLVKVAI